MRFEGDGDDAETDGKREVVGECRGVRGGIVHRTARVRAGRQSTQCDVRALITHRHIVCCEATRGAARAVGDIVHRIKRAREEEALALLRLLRREQRADQRWRERSVALEARDALHRAVSNVHARGLGEARGAEVVAAAQTRALVAALIVHAHGALVLGAAPCNGRLARIVCEQRPEPRLAVAVALRGPQR